MLLNKKYDTRAPVYLGLGTLLALLVFAWHFYLERTAFYDLSYHLLVYLQEKALFVQNRRFVAIVTQLPTLLAIKAGLPLAAVMRLYSVVFIIYYLAVFLCCAFWLRNEQVALVVALAFVLLAARSFYWAQSELPQSLAALLLFYAGIARQAPLQRRFSTLALATLVPVFIFGHPLMILPFLFIWAYDWLLNKRYKDWGYYALLVLALAMYKLRDALTPPGSYETMYMTFKPNLVRLFPDYFSITSFDTFWYLCSHNFLALPILLVTLTAFYLQKRTWEAGLRLALVWLSVLGYAFVINVSKPDYTEPTYLENIYLPLTLFVAIPFAMELLPALERIWQGRLSLLTTGLLALVLVVRLGVLWNQHTPYTAYQQWLTRLLAYTRQFPEHKYIMYPSNVDPYNLRAGWPWWSMASETVMTSAQHGPDSVQTVRVGWDIDELAQTGLQPGVFLTPFKTLKDSDLPNRYCHFPPNSTYRVLNTLSPLDTASLRSYIAAHAQVRLTLVDSLPAILRTAQDYTIPVRISVPPAAQPLHSSTRLPYPTALRTAFYQEDHEWPADVPPLPVALEVDVWQPWTQTLLVHTPKKPGRYIFDVSLISKGYRDWPVRVRVPVNVVE